MSLSAPGQLYVTPLLNLVYLQGPGQKTQQQAIMISNSMLSCIAGLVCCEATMRVAVVHEWLVTLGGSESVLKQILECFPNADVFAVIDFLPAEDRDFSAGDQ